MKRKRLAALVAACAVTGGMLAVGQAGANLSGSTFEGNDGNMVHASGGTDWDNGPNVHIGTDLSRSQNDNAFGNGSHEDDVNVSVVTGSIPNSKADIGRFADATEVLPNGDTMLYLAWIRNDDSGSVNFDFELNKVAQPDLTTPGPKTLNRTVNDVLINYSLQGGAQVPTLNYRKWNGTVWGPVTPFSAGIAEAGFNQTTTIVNALGGPLANIAPARFGEGAINMTAAGLIPNKNDANQPCRTFASAYVKSRSSQSFNSEIKDFVAPVPFQDDTCGTITVKKITNPSPDPTDTTFNYTRSGPGTAFDAPFSLKDGQQDAVVDLVPGSYTVSEADPGPNFALENLSCVEDKTGNTIVSGLTANITLDADENVTCTYTNKLQRGNIIVKKVAERPGVPFHFDASYDADGFDLADGEQNDSGELLPGTYSVSEDVLDGWNLQSATCDDNSDPAAIDLDPDETVTCTFTNVIERGALVIHKDRKHAADGPGDHPHAGVTFTVAGQPGSFLTDGNGNICVPNLPVSFLDGPYTVTEQLPAGYSNPTLVKQGTVVEGGCADATPVTFLNTPLTNLTLSVDSQVDGGTASTIDCGAGTQATGPTGDGSTTRANLEPGTYTCTVVIDP